MKSFPNVITARPFSHHAYQENLQYFSKVKTSVNGLLARIIHLKLPLLHWLLIETLIRYYSPGGMIHCSPRRLKRKKHYINRYSLQVLIFLFIVFGYFVIFQDCIYTCDDYRNNNPVCTNTTGDPSTCSYGCTCLPGFAQVNETCVALDDCPIPECGTLEVFDQESNGCAATCDEEPFTGDCNASQG